MGIDRDGDRGWGCVGQEENGEGTGRWGLRITYGDGQPGINKDGNRNSGVG